MISNILVEWSSGLLCSGGYRISLLLSRLVCMAQNMETVRGATSSRKFLIADEPQTPVQHTVLCMKHYDGVIDKAQKQSANKINMEVLCRDVVAAAKDITRDCILNGWNSMWKRDRARA